MVTPTLSLDVITVEAAALLIKITTLARSAYALYQASTLFESSDVCKRMQQLKIANPQEYTLILNTLSQIGIGFVDWEKGKKPTSVWPDGRVRK